MKNTPTQLEPNAPVTRSHSMGFVILISCAAGLGGLLYGYDTAVISGAIGFLKDLYSLTPFMEGLVISSIMIGGVAGVGISGFLSDRFGRRKILMTAALLFAISAIVSALSQDVSTLIIARIIGGLGIGMAHHSQLRILRKPRRLPYAEAFLPYISSLRYWVFPQRTLLISLCSGPEHMNGVCTPAGDGCSLMEWCRL